MYYVACCVRRFNAFTHLFFLDFAWTKVKYIRSNLKFKLMFIGVTIHHVLDSAAGEIKPLADNFHET